MYGSVYTHTHIYICIHTHIHVHICSPSTSPVPEAVGRKLLFGPLAEEGLVGAGRGRQRADQTGPDRRTENFGIGPEIQPEVRATADPLVGIAGPEEAEQTGGSRGGGGIKLKLRYRNRYGTGTV